MRPAKIHVSKSTLALYERCPLAYRYEKVDRRAPDEGVAANRAQVLGSAGHEAIAAALRGGAGAERSRIDKALSAAGVVGDDAAGIADGAEWAAQLARSRGGHLRWIEELLAMERMPGVTVWAKFDAAIAKGTVAPLEVIDWTFGKARVRNEHELKGTTGARIYRLVAGAVEPDAKFRPIAITEVHVPSRSIHTVVMTDAEVSGAYDDIKQAAARIASARSTGEFPARPGTHCSFCAYHDSCDAVSVATDAVPF